MSSCCNNTNKQKACITCIKNAKTVAIDTIKHHLKEPWLWQPLDEQYYYCDNKQCSTVYFSESENISTSKSKTDKNDGIVCYCFNVSEKMALDNRTIKGYVVQQTKNKNCHCDNFNPSGRCCLKDFPK